MNEKKNLIKNTIIITIGKISTQIITFLLLPLYTRELSTEEYGIYDLLITISVFLLPFVTCLLEESMFRFLIDAKDELDKKKIITQTVICLLINTTFYSIIGAIVVTITKYEYGMLFILYIISSVLISLSNALARGTGKFKLYSIANFITGIIIVISNLTLILKLNMGMKSLFISTIAANIISFTLVFLKLKGYQYVKINLFDRKLTKTMIKYSLPLVPNSISWSIINVSDRIVITNVLGSAANGIYAIAAKFPSILSAFYGYFSTAWKESASRNVKKEDKDNYYNEILIDIKRIMTAVLVCMIAFMPILFSILIADEYNEAYKYIPLLIVAAYFHIIAEFYGGIFVAFKDTKILGKTTFIGALVNLIINIILIKSIGIYAAVISTAVSNLYMMIYRRTIVKKYVKFTKERNIMLYIIVIVIVLLYYCSNIYTNALMIIIALIYSYRNTKDIILHFKNKLINKLAVKK